MSRKTTTSEFAVDVRVYVRTESEDEARDLVRHALGNIEGQEGILNTEVRDSHETDAEGLRAEILLQGKTNTDLLHGIEEVQRGLASGSDSGRDEHDGGAYRYEVTGNEAEEGE